MYVDPERGPQSGVDLGETGAGVRLVEDSALEELVVETDLHVLRQTEVFERWRPQRNADGSLCFRDAIGEAA